VKRLALLVALLLAATVLAGCGGDHDVVTVNGKAVLTDDELTTELDQMLDDDEFLTTNDARGENGNLRSGFVAVVLTNHVASALLAEELEAGDIDVADEDRAAAEDLVQLQLQQPQAEGVAPSDIDDLPDAYRDSLVGLYANFIALIVSGSDDPQADRDTLAQGQPVDAISDVQDRLQELRLDADVDIDSRYGRWDAELGEVAPPEGPVSPTTTALTVPGG
jgi:hypothetical protein